MRKAVFGLLSIGLALVLSACSSGKETALDTLRFGLLPGESEEQLRERYTPLFEFLSEETGIPYRLIVPDTYGDLIELFATGQIDLANFGGFTFVKANMAHGAVPLVMRDTDTRFTSLLLASAESPVKGLSELKGKRFTFGSRLSTSGHLMPRFFLQTEKAIVPEDYFASVRYSGKHDRTVYWVRDGEVDAGVANAAIVTRMIEDGRLGRQDVRSLWETPPYPDYVWAARAEIPEADREKIRQAFLKLSMDDPRHGAILGGIDAGGFLPASVRDFSQLKVAMADLQLSH